MVNIKKTLLFLSLLLFKNSFTQNIINFPSITVDKNAKDIEVKKLKISVFVLENIAKTTYEIDFYNSNDRIMEGELNFPLKNGVTLSRFALDINGELREGVVVEKEKATQIFESIVREKIDPGIAEITKGNNFKSRVYPINPKSYKKIVIAFEEELKTTSENYIYKLPLNFKNELDEFIVTSEVVLNKPEIIKLEDSTINLNFTKERNSYISEYSKKNITLNNYIAFAIPKPNKVNKVQTYKGEVTSDNYFYININPKLEYRNKTKPKNITLIWDESNSSNQRNINKEIDFLKKYINWVKEVDIELISFSNIVHTKEKYKIKEGKCEELLSKLQNTKFDGATNIGAIDFQNLKSNEVLLFSDGLFNFGKKPKTKTSVIVNTINSSNVADHNFLENIAYENNGVYVNLFGIEQKEGLELLTKQQKRFIKSEYNKENIKDFYPKVSQIVNEYFSCVGKVEGSKNEIKLHFGFGNEITETHIIEIDNSSRIDNNIGERIWAQKKLKAIPLNNKSEISEHGKKYSLVTEGTSFIVLDRLDDYVDHNILPPKSLQKEYYNIISNRDNRRKEWKIDRIKNICSRFKNDIVWWNTKYPIKEKNKELHVNYNDESITTESEMLLDISISDGEYKEDDVITGTPCGVRTPKKAFTGQPLKENSEKIETKANIKLNKWESKASYINDLKASDPKDYYEIYLKLKENNKENPMFYFDVATFLFQKKQNNIGLRVISNLAELELENTELLRTLGRVLAENKYYDEAIYIFEDILAIRSFEPHSYIDLGTVYTEKGEYQKAIDCLYKIIDNDWNDDIYNRFEDIELIVLHDINNIISKHRTKVDISSINECFIYDMPVDIRIVIDWNADDTDIDLWVTDPNKDICSYNKKNTKIGGRISNDITGGYGPEEFRLKKAINGDYKIEVKFYGSSKQTILKNVNVRAYIYTNFGRKNEKKQIMSISLDPKRGEVFTIGEINFKK